MLPALLSAFDKCNRLHRDISKDNIIIIRDSEGNVSGRLIDWEFFTVSDEKGAARDYIRSVSIFDHIT